MTLSGGYLPRPGVLVEAVTVDGKVFTPLRSSDYVLSRFCSPRPLNEKPLANSQTLAVMREGIWEAVERLAAKEEPEPDTTDAGAAGADAADLLGLDMPTTPRNKRRRNTAKRPQAFWAIAPATVEVRLPDGWSFLALTPSRRDQCATMESTTANWGQPL